MKTILAILLGFALNVAAQTNFGLLLCKNATFTNATIIRSTPAYVVVSHLGGLSKVVSTNLPDALQKQFGYDPQKAAEAIAAEEKQKLDGIKAKLEKDRYLASLRGTNQKIQVIAMIDAATMQYQTSVGIVYLNGLPATLVDYLNRYHELKSSKEIYSEKVNKLHRNSLSPDGTRQDVNDMILAQDDLNKIIVKLRKIEPELSQNTSVMAYSTGLQKSGIPIWQCVGLVQKQ